MEKVKLTIKNIVRFGYIEERKADKVKVAIFDTKEFIDSNNHIYWGHYIKSDWFESNEVENLF